MHSLLLQILGIETSYTNFSSVTYRNLKNHQLFILELILDLA